MNLKVLEGKYKVVRLKSDESVPKEILNEEIYSITRTDEELSILVRNSVNIKSSVAEENWRIIKIEGMLDFSLIGILSKIATILANANISIFAISTYNTDYLLVKDEKLESAIEALESNGYQFIED